MSQSLLLCFGMAGEAKKNNVMEECVIIVDNSNVWIEGKKFSAREKGIKTGDDP